jgi:recombination protein RecA
LNIGNKVKIKVVKNKTAQPFKEGFVDIIFGEGISKEGSLIDVGVEMGILDKSGSWISFGETRIGQGRDAAKTFLKEHLDMAAQVEKKIKEKAGLLPMPAAPAEKDKAKTASVSPSPTETAPSKPVTGASVTPFPAKVEPKKDNAFVPTEKAKLALKK